jgi:arylsulfatase A-like enzyme
VATAALLAVVATLVAPLSAQGLQPVPPDVLLLHGTGGPLLYAFGLQARPKALPVGRHEALPPAAPAPLDAPSIIVIVGESVRRDAVCAARDPRCDESPAVDAAAPARLGFTRAFSVASCTELSTAVLWSGLPITTSLDALSRAPLSWDWAKARGYRTAYITSQNLLFQQMDLFLRGSRIDLLREARHRNLGAHIDDGSPDEELGAEALAFLASAESPAFLVVHHANTHAPYRVVPGHAPFAGEDARTRYRNSVFHEDLLVGDFLTKLRKTALGARAVVVYTSDHGEAWGEHGAYYHSFDLYAEQTDIPLWIDAPALPEASRARLRAAADRPVSTLDLSATLVDLLGGLDDPALRERASALAGTSLLRDAPAAPRDVFLWNCPPSRECATEAFGVIRHPLKLHYVAHEHRYVCADLGADPGELRPLAEARCAPLREGLDGVFGRRDAPRR